MLTKFKMIDSVLHVLNGERGLDTYPSVYNAMYLLAEYGAKNHIITGGSVDGFESLIHAQSKFDGGYLRRALQLNKMSAEFDLLILYEPRDIEIFQLSKMLGSKIHSKAIIHHSLEIPTKVFARKSIKDIVHRYFYRGYQLLDLVAIQDLDRWSLLCSCFPSLREVDCVYVPNSYMPETEPVANSVEWFDEIKQYGRPVVSYTGAIERWALSLDFFSSICKNHDFSFVFSGWSFDGFAKEAMEYCSGFENIYFDIKQKNRTELNYIVKNSDIGFIIYNSSDPNVYCVGLSSGKLHKFLSYYKPVVVNNIASVKSFIEKNGFGIVSSLEDVSHSLNNVMINYELYTNTLRNNYHKTINFRSSYMDLINVANAVAASKSK